MKSRTMPASAWLLLLLIGTQAEAECQFGNANPRVAESTPDSDFIIIAENSIRHDPTRLIWQRCPLGQGWDGLACVGSPQLLDWQSALQAAASHQQDGFTDWRLPNRNELATIVENRCFQPAINAAVFPDTQPVGHWTGSPQADQPGQAWLVEFAHGAVLADSITATHAVRLVRAIGD